MVISLKTFYFRELMYVVTTFKYRRYDAETLFDLSVVSGKVTLVKTFFTFVIYR